MKNFGGLWLYLKDTTLEAHEGNDDYDFAFNFDGISHNDLVEWQMLFCNMWMAIPRLSNQSRG